jgi:hypothetical protein
MQAPGPGVPEDLTPRQQMLVRKASLSRHLDRQQQLRALTPSALAIMYDKPPPPEAAADPRPAIMDKIFDPSIKERNPFLPIGKREDGSFTWAQPGITKELVEAGLLPGAAAQGYLATPEDATRAALELGLLGTGAARMMTKAVPGETTLGIFGGTLAETGKKEMLKLAMKMRRDGVERDIILRETGWFKGTDSKWKFTVDELPEVPSRVQVAENLPSAKLPAILEQPPLYGPLVPTAKVPPLMMSEDLVSTGGPVQSSLQAFTRRPLRGAKTREFPGIWGRPDVIAADAAARARNMPENPALKEVFGVTRDDLYNMLEGRTGTVSGDVFLNLKPGARGSATAAGIMTPANEQRIIDVLTEAGKYPELHKGMDAWYVADPAFQVLAREYGEEEAIRLFERYRTLSGMASPGTAVPDEIIRGGAANTLAAQGRFADFMKYAGKPHPDTPADMLAANIPGHVYHSTSQAPPMARYLESGKVSMTTPKVPLYVGAFGDPNVPFQTNRAVPDAHFTRAIGLSDMRGGANPGRSMSMPEAQDVLPWFEGVAGEAGIQSVPAQGRLWGAMANQTGVAGVSSVGAPKLEMIAIHIKKLAQKHGKSLPEAAAAHLAGKLMSLPLAAALAAGTIFVEDLESGKKEAI